jgi:hypothetical protein
MVDKDFKLNEIKERYTLIKKIIEFKVLKKDESVFLATIYASAFMDKEDDLIDEYYDKLLDLI